MKYQFIVILTVHIVTENRFKHFIYHKMLDKTSQFDLEK